MTSTAYRLCLNLWDSIPTLDDHILSKDSLTQSLILSSKLQFSYPGGSTVSGAHFLPHAPHGSTMHYVRISLWIVCSKSCPLPDLVIGKPLTMNNDRHHGAKCPVQDIVGIFLLTGGEQHLFGCWKQCWLIRLTNTPHLKVTVSHFRNALRVSCTQCRSDVINTSTNG